jgi:hypothetical protein
MTHGEHKHSSYGKHWHRRYKRESRERGDGRRVIIKYSLAYQIDWSNTFI